MLYIIEKQRAKINNNRNIYNKGDELVKLDKFEKELMEIINNKFQNLK